MDLKTKVLRVLAQEQIGVLATIRDNKPHSSFMMLFHEDVTLYVAADRQSKKVTDIKKNNHVHVLVGSTNNSWNEPFVEIEGTASLEDNETLKHKFWNDALHHWLQGPDDPNYVLVKITPVHIYLAEKAGTPEKLSL
ncbi:pyridoxamine 5'-phosphate oxidase family protein [Ectobacillus sp. sgz5001026]|uniref:pyridoxamine 5'-phosphate oxidase family protein n=1 Tax=Ectobacillus sp. sgz5001026 TaxID=3242473 RepID=UPI0036D37C62